MSTNPTLVLLCDDSGADTVALQRFLEHEGDISVVGSIGTGADAVQAVADLKPDLVAITVAGGTAGALRSVEQIMGRHPLPILVVSDDAARAEGEAALAAGALELLAQSTLDLEEPGSPAAAEVRRRIVFLSQMRVIRHPRDSIARRRQSTQATRTASAIGICASTGGPQIVERLLKALPAPYPIPVLVVQHMTAGFTESLAAWLAQTAGRSVRVASDGIAAAEGVWLAPEGAHLKLTGSGLLELDSSTIRGVHRPSGDILLESIAAAAGRFGVGVVLTGMGEDGALGLRALRREGGFCIAQDEASSAVYGMPKAALAGGADLVLTPPEIAAWLGGLRHRPLPVVE